MINRSKLAVISAIAAMSIASPAIAQSSHGAQTTGSASNREDLNFGQYPSDFASANDRLAFGQNGRESTAARASGLHAYAMVPHARTFYDYSPGFPGGQFSNGYSPATSGYDPGIETQR